MPLKKLNQSLFLTDTHADDLNRSVLLKVILWFALAVHLALIPTFYLYDQYALAAINVLSSMAWVCAIIFLQKGKTTLAIKFACTEVFVHSFMVCFFLGTDLGFQFYLWAIYPIVLLDYRSHPKLTVLLCLFLVACFGAIYLLFNGIKPPEDLAIYADTIHFINVMVAAIPQVYFVTMMRDIAERQHDALKKTAAKDFLTGLYNRRFASEEAEKIKQHAIRHQHALTVVMTDIDHFKRINDELGHDAGDATLTMIADFFKSHLRTHDLVARWGGEEFLLIFNQLSPEDAFSRVEQLREALTEYPQDTVPWPITASFGMSEWRHSEPLEMAIKRADIALYHSKHSGRDQTTLWHRDLNQLHSVS